MLTYAVLAVNLETKKVRIIAVEKTENGAEATVNLAVFRRGVETEFFVAVPATDYSEGETWKGQKEEQP